MAKGAIPPTLSIALYQAQGSSEIYGTVGYIIAIASTLSLAIQPRAKFIQAMISSVFVICLVSAITLFAIWTAIQARHITVSQPETIQSAEYDSSAAVICAVWLFFIVFCIHCTLQSPQAKTAKVLSSIFTVVAMVNGVGFSTISIATAFVKTLLGAMLTGCAIAAGTSLLIFPLTCRQTTFKQMNEFLSCMNTVLKAQTTYMHSMETRNMFQSDGEAKSSPSTESSPSIELKTAVDNLRSLYGILQANISFAKQEIAVGKLSAKDISNIVRLFRRIFLPLIGMSSLIDVFERVGKSHGFGQADRPPREDEQEQINEWQTILLRLHEPFESMQDAMAEAIQHVLIVLELQKKATKASEDSVNSILNPPGSPGFANAFQGKIQNFYELRAVSLVQWCQIHEIGLPQQSDANFNRLNDYSKRHRHNRQLLIALYMEYLLWSSAQALLNLVKFADDHVQKGTFKKRRLIVPGFKKIKRWYLEFMRRPKDSREDINNSMDETHEVYLGTAFYNRKDPEHLDPKGAWQKFGNVLRKVPKIIRSPDSVFASRVALAMVCLGIPAFLESTHEFFIEQRLFWALIMIAVAMSRTSGQAVFIYTVRILATIFGMVISYIVYYVVDGSTPGSIAMLWFAIFGLYYVIVKYPHFILVTQVSAVTIILIVGYELQVAKVGETAAAANGQRYYPLYLLAPYRLGVTTAGIFVAFIFTIFPFPISESSELRKDLGAALYLAAQYYTVLNETVAARVRGDIAGDETLSRSGPAYQLEKKRTKIFSKLMLLIARMKSELSWTRWQITVGGEFPAEIYGSIIKCVENIIDYTALTGLASVAFSMPDNVSQEKWRNDFKRLLSHTHLASDQIPSLLCLLASSISNSQPLPPHIRIAEDYHLLQSLHDIDREILGISHIADPGYSAFAVMQIASRSVISDLSKLKQHIEELVGSLDFSVYAMPQPGNEA